MPKKKQLTSLDGEKLTVESAHIDESSEFSVSGKEDLIS